MVKFFDKYQNQYSTIFSFGCVIDLRMKFQFLNYVYSRLHSKNLIVEAQLSIVTNASYKLFIQYVNMEVTPTDSSPSSPTNKKRKTQICKKNMMQVLVLIDYFICINNMSVYLTINLYCLKWDKL